MGKLSKKLSKRIAAFLVLVFISMSLLFVWLASRLLEDEYLSYLSINESEVRFLFEEASFNVKDKNVALEKMGEMFNADIYTCDADGKRMHNINNISNGKVSEAVIDEYLKNALDNGAMRNYSLLSVLEKRRIFDAFKVSGLDGEAAAFIVYDIDSFIKNISVFFWIIFVTLLVFLLIFIAFGYKFSGRIMEFIENASESARKIAAGDYSQRISIKGDDELSDFAESFNKLAMAIGERIDTITTQKAELQEYAQRQKEFTSNAAHELKNPLTSILGSAELLKNMEADVTKTQLLEMIIRNSTRLRDIINMLLTLARVESGRVDENFMVEELILQKTLIGLAENVEKQYSEKKITFFYKFTVESNLVIKTAKVLFTQIFSNLFDNACKYTREESVVCVAVDLTEEGISIEISNDGEIDKESLPHIFERFYRTRSARTGGYGGVGLGLAITKHMVLVLGGVIRVKSENGKTVFTVEFSKELLQVCSSVS